MQGGTNFETQTQIFFANILYANKIVKLREENAKLEEKITKYENQAKEDNINEPVEIRKKRLRKTKPQVYRMHRCKVPDCGKSYG